MRRKAKRKFGIFLVLLSILLSGCDIHMSAEERVGNHGQEVDPSESLASETEAFADIRQLPILTIEYNQYNIYDLAREAFGLQPEEVDRNLDKYGQLMLTPQNREIPYGNTMISIFTGGLGVNIRWEDDAECYRAVFPNAVGGAWENGNTDYLDEPSNVQLAFPMDPEMEDKFEKAAEDAAGQLEALGFRIDSWYGGITNAAFWQKYFEQGYNLVQNFTPEEEICYLEFIPQVEGLPLESTERGSISTVYSINRKKLLLLDAEIPLLGDVQPKKEIDVISASDAEMLAESVIKANYQIHHPEIAEIEPVYFRPMMGGLNEDKQTLTV